MTAADGASQEGQGFEVWLRGGGHYVREHPGLIVSLLIIGSLLVTALLAPWIAPFPNDAGTATNLLATLQPPGGEHPLGTGSGRP